MCFGHEPLWIRAWFCPLIATTEVTQQIINELTEVVEQHNMVKKKKKNETSAHWELVKDL